MRSHPSRSAITGAGRGLPVHPAGPVLARPSHQRRRRALVVLALAGAALLVAIRPPGALAVTPTTPIVSYDKTATLNVNFYPALNASGGQLDAPAPTVIIASPWAGKQKSATTGDTTASSINIGGYKFLAPEIGPASLLADGYNVVTYDPRGWYNSTGQVTTDMPTKEGEDPSAIIDWLAGSDPRLFVSGVGLVKFGNGVPLVGMTGVSYGGAAQLEAAANDPRIAVIEPGAPTYSATQSLDPNGIDKEGFAGLLCASAVGNASFSPQLAGMCADVPTGSFTPADIAFANSVGPYASTFSPSYKVPTLLMAGDIDTLFPLSQDLAIYGKLQQTSAPVKMVWGCAGHGLCNESATPLYSVLCMEHAWLDKYLGVPYGSDTTAAVVGGTSYPCVAAPNDATATDFAYSDQTGTLAQYASYPTPTGAIVVNGGGTLGLDMPDSGSGFIVGASPALNALNITVPAPASTVELTAPPTLSLTYTGAATHVATPVFAQLVDAATNTVVDNQATAIPLTLDGRQHTVTLPLNTVLWNFQPGKNLELQITDDSNLFYDNDAFGAVSMSAQLTVPTVAPGGPLS